MLDLNLYDFNLNNNYISCEYISNGHINKTFKLTYPHGEYIAQIVNSEVFQSISSVMANISIVCNHLKSNNVPTLEYLTSNNGLNYSINSNGEYVRICKYVKNSICLDFSNDLEYIYNAGLGFGQFLNGISNIPTNAILDTIPNFHDTKLYINRLFHIANSSNYQNRVDNSTYLLNDIYRLMDFSNVTQPLKKRVTHNDIKFTNILLNSMDKSILCVIDLDTIMNGYLPYDFADGVRSICRNADNTLNLDKFNAYSKGFLKYPMSMEDKSALIDSIVAVSLELSSRYLYEYLNGSNYFNLKSIRDNFSKSNGYIKFARDVISKRDTLKV